MRPPTQKQLLYIINSLDWMGHVELPEIDKTWLSGKLAESFIEDKAYCGACQVLKEIVVQTPLGPVCTDCIDEFQDEGEQIREILEAH